jgi:hypothetical protein
MFQTTRENFYLNAYTLMNTFHNTFRYSVEGPHRTINEREREVTLLYTLHKVFQKELYNFERVYKFIQRTYTTF